ncbi:murein biosynthesis integral membrane protein MurJ [Sporichthya polymorpha]|uniref:murein biosynthesis integral membrane protein MurJ n=1 Tax=Sporichthya polymorpha TaxID=35751 RepID=UPI00039D57CF|nr:murein biosynthesis integral membrane protein MurJ [Sporichthya polymorpha]
MSSAPTDPPGPPAEPSITRSSAVMAAGTVLSRITGFGRDVVLTWAIGTTAFSVTYNVANTVPNIVYILLAGGVLNAVFVPQLVKAMREDPDGGKAFADRLITAIGLVLLVITVAAVIAAPLVISAYAYAFTHGEGSEANYDVAVTFARYLLPQIFFYGLHVMLGQVLNARGRFGPMMFAPILNNLVVIVTGVMFLVITAGEHPSTETISDGEMRLLGVGTTLGVIVQALALLPFLKSSGYRYRPRFDLRGTGLGQAYRLATWTLLFVLVNQIAYLVVVQIATGIEETAAADGYPGRGFTPYTKAYLIMLLPHAVITVSVVTALLPRMARAVTDDRLDDVRTDLAGGMKLTGAALIPAAIAFVVLGPSMAVLGFGHGNTSVANAEYIGYVLAGFAVALVPFSVHHQLLRGFYAFSDTRTPVSINVWIAGTNIALALACVALLPARWVAVGLALSYAASYAVGVQISARKLGRYLGPLDGGVVRTYERMALAAVLAAIPAVAVAEIADQIWGTGTTAAAVTVIGGGGAMLVAYLAITMRMRITEVTQLLGPVLRR